MRDKIKVKRSISSPRDFSFADGPNEGDTAFTVSVEDGAKIDREYGNLPRVLCKCGITVLHFHGIEIVKPIPPKPKNAITIEAKCGQEMTLELDDIDESQPISEVTIRGVRYTPSK